MFGALAKNVAASFRPGSPIVVSGDMVQSVRVVEGAAQTRNEVKASMMGRDVILAPVILSEAAASGPAQSGPTEQFGASEAPHASVSGATHRWAQPRRVRLGAASSPRLGSPARDTGESLARSRTS